MTTIWRVRAVALLLLGGIVVHEGRYLLAPPDHVHGGIHAYLAWLVPIIGLAALFVAGQFAARVLSARGDGEFSLPSARYLFPIFLAVLLTVFGLQETIEATLAEGVLPSENVFIAGGAWVATPIAVLVAGLLALLLRGAAAVMRAVAARLRRPALRPARTGPRLRSADRPVSPLLSLSLAPRGPPLLS